MEQNRINQRNSTTVVYFLVRLAGSSPLPILPRGVLFIVFLAEPVGALDVHHDGGLVLVGQLTAGEHPRKLVD